ncbi:MAG: ComF family protein [Bacteroidales bacterium]|nr:ComF family protein [Bacteroidales bacterium]
MLASFRKAARAALALLAGEHCVMCGTPLRGGQLCPSCWLSLPYTHLRAYAGNPIDRLFWDDARVVAASAYLWYKPEYAVAQLVHALKYGGRYDLGLLMGEVMAHELADSDFFATADALLPVPLSKQRYRQRGYNQSLALAEGVNRATGLPIVQGAVVRHIDNPSQTSLDAHQRLANVEGIFSLSDSSALSGRHVVVIDDVITVGATIGSLLRTLSAVPNLRASILVLCAAGRYHMGAVHSQQLGLPDASAQLHAEQLRRYRP